MSLSDQQVDEIKSTLVRLTLENLAIEVELELEPRWSAAENNFRLEIRKHIRNKFHDDQSPLDLDRLPQHHGRYISISHNQKLGGYAYCEAQQIGFDLEETSRILQPIVFRVCDPQEQNLVISPSHLWAAKEATFKAAIEIKPKVLSEVKIQAVSSLDSKSYVFNGEIRNGGHFRGITHEFSGITFAIAVFDRSAV